MPKQFTVQITPKFEDFLTSLDKTAKNIILARITRLKNGNFGDKSHIGDGIIELRIDSGPGYRVYCKQIGQEVVIVLGAGTKNRQQSDIDAAKAYAAKL